MPRKEALDWAGHGGVGWHCITSGWDSEGWTEPPGWCGIGAMGHETHGLDVGAKKLDGMVKSAGM